MARELLYGQFYHETGGGTSAIYKENNNLFGMKLPAKRPTTAIGENRGHAVYKTESDSIQDLLMWLAMYGKTIEDFRSAEEYVSFLAQKGYFTDSPDNYLRGLKAAMA